MFCIKQIDKPEESCIFNELEIGKFYCEYKDLNKLFVKTSKNTVFDYEERTHFNCKDEYLNKKVYKVSYVDIKWWR